MRSVFNCHNIVKHTKFYLGWLSFNVASAGNAVGWFKRALQVFQLLLCDECYENVYT
jgi:hypothetical protein